MGGDYGLYQALRGTDNWAQKRQDKMQSLMIAEKRDQNAQRDLKQSMEMEQGMQKHFDQMNQLDALAEDQGRINDVEKAARRKIYKGIAAANGNLKAYMSSGGISALSEYKNSVLNSEAAKNAVTNKSNYANWIKDSSDGKFIKKVNVEVPVMSNGEVVLDSKTGKPKTQMKNLSMKEQAALFQKGIIKKINYGGAEDAVKMNMLDFHDQAKDPNNPYFSENVTTSDIINLARSRGASLEQAKTIAKDYALGVSSGAKPWNWGKEDYNAALLKQARVNKLSSAGKGGSSKTMVLNQLSPGLNRLANTSNPEGARMSFGLKDDKMWSEYLGLRNDVKSNMTKPSRPLKGVDRDTGAEYDLSNAMDIKFSKEYVGKNGESYILADVTYDADEPRSKNPHEEGLFGYNSLTDDNAIRNWEFLNIDQTGINYDAADLDDGMDVVRGQVLIPIGSIVNDPLFKDTMNKFRGITSAQEGTAASVNNQEYVNQAQEGFDRAVDYVMSLGYSQEEAEQYYYEHIR